jgi:sulfate permease, SulP family
MNSHLRKWIPALDWALSYKKHDLQGDMTAGVTTAVMLIPQAMAYAMLAGLPPVIGLYASIVPLLVYALLGTSRQLAVGPVAMVALLVSSGIGGLVTDGNLIRYVSLTVLLTLLVGAIQFSMGLLRLGFLTNFLSHPVISGFTSAAALIIGFSQVKHLVGLNLPRTDNILQLVRLVIKQVEAINVMTLALGLACIVFLVGLRKVNPLIPGALLAVVLSSLITWGFDLVEQGVKIVAEVPAGLPPFSIPEFTWSDLSALLPIALTISFVGFIESIAIAKQIASEKQYEIDSNKELLALGAANILGAFFKAMPVTGGFSRTAVNKDAGANTGLSGIITAVVIGIALLFLTPLLYYLPKTVLGAIIMVAVFGLVDFHEIKHLWAVKRDDLVLLIITFLATLIIGVKEGIFTGMILSVLWFVVKTTRPHYAILGKLPGKTDYRNTKRHSTESTGDILVIRFDAQFYYGNVSFLKEILKKAEVELKGPMRGIVIDASSVNQLDSSADTALHEIIADYRYRDIGFYFANVKGPVLDVMKQSGFYEKLGDDCCYKSVHEAVMAAKHALC